MFEQQGCQIDQGRRFLGLRVLLQFEAAHELSKGPRITERGQTWTGQGLCAISYQVFRFKKIFDFEVLIKTYWLLIWMSGQLPSRKSRRTDL